MPYKRPYSTTAKGRKKRGSAMSRYRSKKSLVKTVNKVVNSKIETKYAYTDLDELAVGQNSATSVTPFNLVPHGNAGNQRIGQRIDPVALNLKLWFRPRGLVNSGNIAADPGDQYDSAFYSRIILCRQKVGVRLVAGTPAPIQVTNANLLVGNGGTTQALMNDYRDVLRKINSNLLQVVYDKKFFIPMQYKMKNTQEINFTYRYPKSTKITYSDNSEYPDQPFIMFVINRFADDDAHASEKTIEYSGEAIFSYKDA